MATTSSTGRNPPRLLRATYLADQESLLRETRATGLFYFPGPIVALIIFGILDYLAAGVDGWVPAVGGITAALQKLPSLGSLDAGRWLFTFFIILTLVVVLWLLIRYLYWTSTVYAVTNTRVIVQRGILGRNFDEIPVQQVRGVDVHQSVGQRMLGYGTVKVSSEGGTQLGNENWHGIPKPFEFQRLIENATQVLNRPSR